MSFLYYFIDIYKLLYNKKYANIPEKYIDYTKT